MAPPEYVTIGSLRLNGNYGTQRWWCDFDLGTMPVWGTVTTKGDPSIPIPHADGDFPLTVNLAAVNVSLLGTVYGDIDQSGNPVTGTAAQRLQLADNCGAVMGLHGTRALSYVLHSRTYTGTVVVTDVVGKPQGPFMQDIAIRFQIAAGYLAA